MSRKRVILFGPLPPPFGGVSIFMRALCAKAIEKGAHVWSYTGKPNDENADNPLFVNHRRFAHLLALLRYGFQARITDSTHFHFEYPNILMLPLWICAKFVLRFHWIKILHDGSLPSRYKSFSSLKRLLFQLAVRHINEYIVVNKELETWLRETVKVSKKIFFIPSLLPLPENWDETNLSEELALTLERHCNHKRRVCTIGIFIPSYGFHQVADSVERLRQATNEDIGLLIVDGGYERDEKYMADVLKERKWIAVAANVPHSNLATVFRKSDVFVRGFSDESFGLSRIEAMWCDTPVIATDVGETRGMLIYKFGDISALCLHLQAVFDGKPASDAKVWAEKFIKETEENLTNYLRVIVGDNNKTNVE